LTSASTVISKNHNHNIRIYNNTNKINIYQASQQTFGAFFDVLVIGLLDGWQTKRDRLDLHPMLHQQLIPKR